MSSSPIERSDEQRVAVLTIDHPDRTANVVDERVLADLENQVQAALADQGVDALVLASGKPGGFGVGADLAWLPELAARDDAESFLASVHRLMLTIVRAPKPMVAAVNGAAFGGSLEIALSARSLVAVPDATLSLPEVTLGLLPGGGGTQLLTRFLNTETAAEVLTSGRRLSADEAHDLGLVAEIVDADRLVDRARTLALELSAAATPDPGRRSVRDGLAALEARRRALAESRHGLSIAAAAILDVIEAGLVEGIEAGLAAERRAFLELLGSSEARGLIHLTQAEAGAKRRARYADTRVEFLGVVGAGQMGAGIAATAVTRRLAAVVRDVDEQTLQRARSHLDKVLRHADGGSSSEPAGGLWAETTAWDGFGRVDAVIEAVFELHELKTRVLRDISATVPTDALVGTNTSAIPIWSLVGAVHRPERFLGMHFFNPVHRMPLVELVPHKETSQDAISRAAALGRQLGKVPIVVGDAPGFFTSRVYARWLIEGVRLLLDGVAPGVVDRAAGAVGFPAGPFLAHDEAGLELVLQASITQVAENVMSERLDVASVREALERLVSEGLGGRRAGTGFYRYGPDGRRREPNDDVLRVLGMRTSARTEEEVGERLLLAFASECFLCWDDGTLCHPDDGDVAAVLGIGFPRSLGGPFRWADEQGSADVRARCVAHGSREFPYGATLARLADDGGRFAAEPRRPAPFQDPG